MSTFVNRFSVIFITIFFAVCLLANCGGGGGGSSSVIPTPAPVPVVAEWVIKGDSMANRLAQIWEDSENDGIDGMWIEGIATDARILKKVVLFVGVNNLQGLGEQNTDQMIIDYATLYWSIKGETYCVSVPNTSWVATDKIIYLNEGIKGICGDHYIDTFDMPFASDDGLHPDAAMNLLIKAKILELDAL